MPMPVSLTVKRNRTCSPVVSSSRAPTVISPRSVNLMALLTRLSRTWPSRSGSPTSARRHVGIDVEQQLEPLSCALMHAEVGRGARARRRAGSRRARSSSLPASILEKSRMSLMMPSRRLAARVDLRRGSRAAARVEVGLQRQVRHADDGVHRRADLVAHVGEESALGLVGRLGRGAGLLRLVEQARGLDCDHGLGGEGSSTSSICRSLNGLTSRRQVVITPMRSPPRSIGTDRHVRTFSVLCPGVGVNSGSASRSGTWTTRPSSASHSRCGISTWRRAQSAQLSRELGRCPLVGHRSSIWPS